MDGEIEKLFIHYKRLYPAAGDMVWFGLVEAFMDGREEGLSYAINETKKIGDKDGK